MGGNWPLSSSCQQGLTYRRERGFMLTAKNSPFTSLFVFLFCFSLTPASILEMCYAYPFNHTTNLYGSKLAGLLSLFYRTQKDLTKWPSFFLLWWTLQLQIKLSQENAMYFVTVHPGFLPYLALGFFFIFVGIC